MTEYVVKQRNQLRRAIADGRYIGKQMKTFVDNRKKPIQMWHGNFNTDITAINTQATTRMTALGIPPAAITGLLGASGEKIAGNVQAHHIIPKELYPGVVTGTSFDSAEFNGILLPSTKGLSYFMGRVAHVGAHPVYTAAIGQSLKTAAPKFKSAGNILKNYTADFSSDTAIDAVNNTIKSNRTALEGDSPDTVLS